MENLRNVEKLCEKLSLTAEEDAPAESMASPEELEDMDRILVGKLISPRRIPHGGLQTVFAGVWNLPGQLTCKTLHNNVFQFEFPNSREKNRVFSMQPWIFDRNLLILKKPYAGMVASEVDFNTAFFWVHVHKLPREKFNVSVAESIGNSIGKFVSVEKDTDGKVIGQYLRIRCEIDIRKPLKRVQKLKGVPHNLPLIYEKLPAFCEFCGIIGHGRNDCGIRWNAPLEEQDEIHYTPNMSTAPNQSPFPRSWGGRNVGQQAANRNMQQRQPVREAITTGKEMVRTSENPNQALLKTNLDVIGRDQAISLIQALRDLGRPVKERLLFEKFLRERNDGATSSNNEPLVQDIFARLHRNLDDTMNDQVVEEGAENNKNSDMETSVEKNSQVGSAEEDVQLVDLAMVESTLEEGEIKGDKMQATTEGNQGAASELDKTLVGPPALRFGLPALKCGPPVR